METSPLESILVSYMVFGFALSFVVYSMGYLSTVFFKVVETR